MRDLSRRRFLGATTAVTGAVAAGAVLPAASAQAESASKPSKPGRHGDIRDVKHVVILMQENRSFDHYFGTLQGVRGFGDRSTITLPGGASVFQEPTTTPGQSQFPWNMSMTPAVGSVSPETIAQTSAGLGHSWEDQHGAWSGGLMNGWVEYKGSVRTMGFLQRSDIPFHYALADAYTVGDAYHCSVLSATGPNRTMLWSGTIDAAGKYGKPAYNGGSESNLKWQSYAETLQQAGVTWRVYQGSDNYGDNGLEYFSQFETAQPGSTLYENGVRVVPEPATGVSANADNLAAAVRADVLSGNLPQVSWVVTNQAFSEHPDAAPGDGAYYVSEVLKALNADPDVFNSTVVIIDYDENDGFFDHVPPPIPATGTADEFYFEPALEAYGVTTPLPVGLGFRVPLLLISPWTRGGRVTSEVSDHTSVIQFLEKWTTALGTPTTCTYISDWRRKVCGDLTNAFDFRSPVYGLPQLPDTTVLGLNLNSNPTPTTNALPAQEPGRKPSCPLPYQPNANLDAFAFGANGEIQARLSFSNTGPHVNKASHFAVYNNTLPAPTLADFPAAYPGQFTVDPSTSSMAQTVPGSVEIGAGAGDGVYDLTVTGPNRFLRHFTGNTAVSGDTAHVQAQYEGLAGKSPKIALSLVNAGDKTITFTITPNNYTTDGPRTYRVLPHSKATHTVDALKHSHGWYDMSVTISTDPSWSRRYIGHLENGEASITG